MTEKEILDLKKSMKKFQDFAHPIFLDYIQVSNGYYSTEKGFIRSECLIENKSITFDGNYLRAKAKFFLYDLYDVSMPLNVLWGSGAIQNIMQSKIDDAFKQIEKQKESEQKKQKLKEKRQQDKKDKEKQLYEKLKLIYG